LAKSSFRISPTIAAGAVLLVAGGLYYAFRRSKRGGSIAGCSWRASGSLSRQEIEILADQLQAAFWTQYGTEDEEAIYSAMDQLQNNANFLNLICAYDYRAGLGIDAYFWDPLTLVESFERYFSESEREKVNRILARKFIKYRV